MQVLINTVGRGFQFLADMLAALLGRFWDGILGSIGWFAAWAVELVANGVGFVVEAVLGALTVVVGWLPAMPTAPTGSAWDGLAAANRYVPVGEAATLGTLWVALYGGVLVYKLVKFLRGGG